MIVNLFFFLIFLLFLNNIFGTKWHLIRTGYYLKMSVIYSCVNIKYGFWVGFVGETGYNKVRKQPRSSQTCIEVIGDSVFPLKLKVVSPFFFVQLIFFTDFWYYGMLELVLFKDIFFAITQKKSGVILLSHCNYSPFCLTNKRVLVTWFIVYWSSIINMEIPTFSCETWRLDAEFWAWQIMFWTAVNCRLSPVDQRENAAAFSVNK